MLVTALLTGNVTRADIPIETEEDPELYVVIDGLHYKLYLEDQTATVINTYFIRTEEKERKNATSDDDEEEADDFIVVNGDTLEVIDFATWKANPDSDENEAGEDDGSYDDEYDDEFEDDDKPKVKPVNYLQKTITIPASVKHNGVSYKVTEIGMNAFIDSDSLTEVTIPETVRHIGTGAFDNCERLEQINVAAKNSRFCSKNGVLFNKDKTLLIRYPSGKKPAPYSIPAGVKSIGTRAFVWSDITAITIPGSVTFIGWEAFMGCRRLKELVVPESVETVSGAAFSNCYNLESVTWNAVGQDIAIIRYMSPQAAIFDECQSLCSFTFGDKVEVIPPQLCAGLRGLTEITIPASVRTICYGAFSGCFRLNGLIVPETVSTIMEDAFSHLDAYGEEEPDVIYTGAAEGAPWGAKRLNGERTDIAVVDDMLYKLDARKRTATLTEVPDTLPKMVVIPEYVEKFGVRYSVTEIESRVFANNDSLEAVYIPRTITHIGWWAPFRGCTNLREIHVADDNKHYCSIDSVLFSHDMEKLFQYPMGKSAEAYVIPEGVKNIDDCAFEGSRITAVTIPGSVTSIDNGAFRGCEGLTEVVVPESVTSIGSTIFMDCSNLRSVVWNAQGKDDNVGGFVIRYFSYNSDEEAPFAGCNRITSFTFGNKVLTIPQMLCAGLGGLTQLTIPDGVRTICFGAFSGCKNIQQLVVPESVDSIMGHAFGGLENTHPEYRSSIPNVIYHGTANGAPWGATCINGHPDAMSGNTDRRIVK